jgi:hypothetical protein
MRVAWEWFAPFEGHISGPLSTSRYQRARTYPLSNASVRPWEFPPGCINRRHPGMMLLAVVSITSAEATVYALKLTVST